MPGLFERGNRLLCVLRTTTVSPSARAKAPQIESKVYSMTTDMAALLGKLAHTFKKKNGKPIGGPLSGLSIKWVILMLVWNNIFVLQVDSHRTTTHQGCLYINRLGKKMETLEFFFLRKKRGRDARSYILVERNFRCGAPIRYWSCRVFGSFRRFAATGPNTPRVSRVGSWRYIMYPARLWTYVALIRIRYQ